MTNSTVSISSPARASGCPGDRTHRISCRANDVRDHCTIGAQAPGKPLIRVGFILARHFRSGRLLCDWEVISATPQSIKASCGVQVTPTARLGNAERIRMTKAMVLIERTSRPLIEIALDFGVENSSHFCGKFRKSFGMTPMRVRDARRHA